MWAASVELLRVDGQHRRALAGLAASRSVGQLGARQRPVSMGQRVREVELRFA
jgi:hypothetical protein